MIKISTASFLKNVVIKNSKQAEKFLVALENVEKKKSKKVTINHNVEEIKGPEKIRKIFAKTQQNKGI